MKCPACKTPDLMMTDRKGIEIDYCPQCRGVWLDRGELDKLVERSLDEQFGQQAPPPAAPHAPYPHPHAKHDSDYGRHRYKRKSWLSELFD